MEFRTLGKRHRDMRDSNRRAVIALLLKEGVLSRSQIAERLCFDPKTATNVINDLLNRGWIEFHGYLKADGPGRKGSGLQLSRRRPSALGLSAEPERLLSIRTNLKGEILDRHTVPLLGTEKAEILRRKAMQVVASLSRNCRPGAGCLGLGISAPGILSPDRSRWVQSTPLPQWTGIDVLGTFQPMFPNLPVIAEDSSRARALSEALFGSKRRDFILLDVGVGLGAGLFLHGKLIRGAHGVAGEVGHFCVDPKSDRRCRCGKTGCLETMVGIQAILDDYGRCKGKRGKGVTRDVSGRIANIRQLADAAECGEHAAQKVLKRAAEILGRTVGNLIDLLDIDLFISGTLPRTSPFFLECLRREAFRHVVRRKESPVIELSMINDVEGPALGAAALIFVRNVLPHS